MKIAIHEGKQLKLFLIEKKISNAEICNRLKISRQSLYTQYRREFLTCRFKSRLSKADLYPFHENEPTNKERFDQAEEQVKRLQEIIITQAEHIALLLDYREGLTPKRILTNTTREFQKPGNVPNNFYWSLVAVF